MSRRAWTGALVLGLSLGACEKQPDVGDEVGDTGIADTGITDVGDTTDASESTTTGPSCDPAACTASCGYDECGQELQGVCVEQACECHPGPLPGLPCGNCNTYEVCYSQFSINGECSLLCGYTFPDFIWDPQLGCALALPDDLPENVKSLYPFYELEIGGSKVPHGSCDNPMDQNRWWIDAEVTTLTLCAEACANFEQAGAATLFWALSCE